MFLVKVTGVQVDDRFMRIMEKLALNKTGILADSHGEYFDLGNHLEHLATVCEKEKR